MARHPNAPAYFHHSMPARDPGDRKSDAMNTARGLLIGMVASIFGTAFLAFFMFAATQSAVLRVNASYQETSVPDRGVRSVAMAARETR